MNLLSINQSIKEEATNFHPSDCDFHLSLPTSQVIYSKNTSVHLLKTLITWKRGAEKEIMIVYRFYAQISVFLCVRKDLLASFLDFWGQNQQHSKQITHHTHDLELALAPKRARDPYPQKGTKTRVLWNN